MANSIAVTSRNIEGTSAVTYGTITFSGTYATGGEAVAAGALGLQKVAGIELDVNSLTTAANLAVYVPTTAKVILAVPAGTQVANGASLTGVTATFRAIGA